MLYACIDAYYIWGCLIDFRFAGINCCVHMAIFCCNFESGSRYLKKKKKKGSWVVLGSLAISCLADSCHFLFFDYLLYRLQNALFVSMWESFVCLLNRLMVCIITQYDWFVYKMLFFFLWCADFFILILNSQWSYLWIIWNPCDFLMTFAYIFKYWMWSCSINWFEPL